jgi:AcrR family transcriptional regulator
LTSRAITTEAACAKGVLHKHFVDTDAFIAAFVEDRIQSVGQLSASLRESSGTGDVTDNISEFLISLFDSVALEIVALLFAKDTLRSGLRTNGYVGIPLLTQATVAIAEYLSAERKGGRIQLDADINMLAFNVMGSAHLLFAGQRDNMPNMNRVREVVIGIVINSLK